MISKLLDSLKNSSSRLLLWVLLGRNKGPHLTRFYMYKRLDGICSSMNNPSTKVLSISGSRRLVEVIGLTNASVFSASYPDYDILALPFEDESFDVVVSDQVLEHIKGDPQTAINETKRVLKKGGVAVHTTCFMNPIHEHPIDMWRFSPASLEYLCEGWREVIDCGGWGNRVAFACMNMGFRMTPVPHTKWHPLHKIATVNNRLFPIVTWIAAAR